MRSLAATFNEMVAKLDLLLDSQQAFVADASHQLRTPLTALRLRLENLERDLPVAGRRELEGALEEVSRLSLIVDALLTLARADSERSGPASVDPASLLGERVAAWDALAAERGVALGMRAEGELAARAVPERLAQVVDNLLANALEVAPAGSAIELRARRVDAWIELRVSDRGPGLTPQQREHAFDRFWRGGAGRGSGLGLAIVRRLVSADGGTVELQPREGGGLDAVVRLRAAE